MDELRDVRKRISKRRGGYGEEKHRPVFFFRFFYHVIMAAMCICVLVLGLLVSNKLDLLELPVLEKTLQLDDLSKWIPFEKWFSLKEEAVSTTPVYTPLEENQYTNGTNIAYNVYHGVVLHVQTNKDNKQSVSIKQDNGVVATYGNLDEVKVKKGERILKEKILGTYTSYVTIDFLKDQKQIAYDEALKEN